MLSLSNIYTHLTHSTGHKPPTDPQVEDLLANSYHSYMGTKRNEQLWPYMSGRKPFTVEAAGVKKVDGETIPRRHPVAKNKLVTTPKEGINTVLDIIRYAAEQFGNAKALGSRRVIRTHNEKKMVKKMVDGQSKEVEKVWTFFELSEYSYISFVEYEKMVYQVGAGLRKIGMGKSDRLHLFAATR